MFHLMNRETEELIASTTYPVRDNGHWVIFSRADVSERILDLNGETYRPVGDPPVPQTAPASAYVIDIPTFKMRFSPPQLDAIRASENSVVKAFLREIIDDPRTVNINLALPYVQGAMMLLAGLGLIDADDVVPILAPVEL